MSASAPASVFSVPIWRDTDAGALNQLLNEPEVRPWVADAAEGVLDVSRQAADPNNVLLMGEHGGCMFFKLMPGIYELHTQVRPEGKGAWLKMFGAAAAHWMFTRTDAYEVLTRIPTSHAAAVGAARMMGFRHEFTRPAEECKFRGESVAVAVYGRRVQDWMAEAPGLVERGAWLHAFFAEEAKRLNLAEPMHEDDENHNRYAGAAFEMALGGQPIKAVMAYNRWALASRHATVALVSVDPPTIRFDIGLLKLAEGKLEVVLPC